jgi:hypothetical protein
VIDPGEVSPPADDQGEDTPPADDQGEDSPPADDQGEDSPPAETRRGHSPPDGDTPRDDQANAPEDDQARTRHPLMTPARTGTRPRAAARQGPPFDTLPGQGRPSTRPAKGRRPSIRRPRRPAARRFLQGM